MVPMDVTRIAGDIEDLSALMSLKAINLRLAAAQGSNPVQVKQMNPDPVNWTVLPRQSRLTYCQIMNVGMAEEQVEASKFIIRQQTVTATLSQANINPEFLLPLLR